MDRRTGWGGNLELVVAMPFDRLGDHTEEKIRRPSPHFQETLVIVVFGLEGRMTDDLEPYVVMLGDGPKRIVNRGAGDCGGKFLVERLNQMVSIHPDKANAPTHHHNPGTHDFLLKVQ
jgi:hypothetical protein